jgi:hypothetical protein
VLAWPGSGRANVRHVREWSAEIRSDTLKGPNFFFAILFFDLLAHKLFHLAANKMAAPSANIRQSHGYRKPKRSRTQPKCHKRNLPIASCNWKLSRVTAAPPNPARSCHHRHCCTTPPLGSILPLFQSAASPPPHRRITPFHHHPVAPLR